jgi:hypothetical protein
MITYRLRPDGIPIKLDSEAKTIVNAVNKADQKILGYMTNPEYYDKLLADADKLNWPEITETDYNTAKTEILSYLNNL